jgi:hypothetical protein
MFDWLGIKSRWVSDKVILNYQEAIEFVHKLKIANWQEWRFYIKDENFPEFIPKQPNQYYINSGWVNWGEWLGNGKIATNQKVFMTFEEARDFVRKLGLKNSSEWRKYCTNKPSNLPSNPEKTYRELGWISFSDFIGVKTKRHKDQILLSFEDSLEFARSLGLKNEKEWRNWKKHNTVPDNIPPKPEVYYKDSGWCGYSFWLKNEEQISNSKKNFLSFNEAKILAMKFKILTKNDWNKLVKTEIGLPSNPDKAYKDKGWVNWADFLGKNDNL